MSFAAFQTRYDGTDFSFEGRDEAAGILGVLKPGKDPPVVTALTLEDLEREARAYLGKEPAASLYLTDGSRHVHRIMINEKHHAAIEKAAHRTVITMALLVFSVTSLFSASLGSLGVWALLGFVSAAALYTLILRAGLFNAIESAVVCEILLILGLLTIPALQRVRSSAAEPVAPPGAAAYTQAINSTSRLPPRR